MSKVYRLIDAEGREYPSAVPGAIGGNRDGKYGRFDCPAALGAIQRWGDLYRERRVFFADEATAIAAGHRPCGRRMPKECGAWKAARAE